MIFPKRNLLHNEDHPVANLDELMGFAAPAPAVPLPALAEEDPWVNYTVQVRRSTYLSMRQAKYWSPGFGVQRDHVDTVLAIHFRALPGAETPLPAAEYAKLHPTKRG